MFILFILFVLLFDDRLLVNTVFNSSKLKLFNIVFNETSTISNYSLYEKFYNNIINLLILSFCISLKV